MDPKTEVTTPNEATPPVDPVEVTGQSIDTGAANVQDPASPIAVQPTETEPPQVLTKFVGKSFEEVQKAYIDVEKEKGRLANELGETRRKLEELNSRPQREDSKEPIASTPIKTIEQLYEEEAKIDPVQATITYNKRKEYQNQVQNLISAQMNFYTEAAAGRVPAYADFAEHIPVMESITEQFAGMLTPEARLSPQAIQLAYLVAKGLSVTKTLEKATAMDTQKATEIVKKREKAFTESSSAQSSDKVDFSKLSSEERRKILGIVDRSGD